MFHTAAAAAAEHTSTTRYHHYFVNFFSFLLLIPGSVLPFNTNNQQHNTTMNGGCGGLSHDVDVGWAGGSGKLQISLSRNHDVGLCRQVTIYAASRHAVV